MPVGRLFHLTNFRASSSIIKIIVHFLLIEYNVEMNFTIIKIMMKNKTRDDRINFI